MSHVILNTYLISGHVTQMRMIRWEFMWLFDYMYVCAFYWDMLLIGRVMGVHL